MRKPLYLLLFIAVTSGLTACQFSAGSNLLPSLNPSRTAPPPASDTPAQAPTRAETPLPQPSDTAIPVIFTATPPAGADETPVILTALPSATTEPCNQAAPGSPIDVTIPDDTALEPGQSFAKTWRLRNAGACPWTREYTVVFFSGDLLGATQRSNLKNPVLPGQSVDITIDMTAPQERGTYQGNWKLLSPQGQFFGIGPSGDSPFWVRIAVVPAQTPTAPAQPTPEPSPTPVVYLTGLLTFSAGQGLDMDTNQPSGSGTSDFHFNVREDGSHEVAPMNGARMAQFGPTAPTLDECRAANLSLDAQKVEDLTPGTYFCTRSNLGLPGWLRIVLLNPQDHTLTLEALAWSVP